MQASSLEKGACSRIESTLFRSVNTVKPNQVHLLSHLCFVLGFLSILASIAIWFYAGGREPLTQAHAERFGIFVGL